MLCAQRQSAFDDGRAGVRRLHARDELQEGWGRCELEREREREGFSLRVDTKHYLKIMVDVENKKRFRVLAWEYKGRFQVNPVRCGFRNKAESCLLELGHLRARPAAGVT